MKRVIQNVGAFLVILMFALGATGLIIQFLIATHPEADPAIVNGGR